MKRQHRRAQNRPVLRCPPSPWCIGVASSEVLQRGTSTQPTLQWAPFQLSTTIGFLESDLFRGPVQVAVVKIRSDTNFERLKHCGDVESNPGPTNRNRGKRSKNKHYGKDDVGIKRNAKIEVIQFNCDGIRTRQPELQKLIMDNKSVSVIMLQETKLQPRFPFKFPGWHCFRRDRTTPRQVGGDISGGGLITMVKNIAEISCREIRLDDIQGDNNTERLAVELTIGEWKFKLINYYVPPIWETNGESRTQTFVANEALLARSSHILAGDFNGHHPSWDLNNDADDVGEDIANWIADNDARLANDGSHTFNNSRTGKKGCMDLTIASGICVSNWCTLSPLNTAHLPIKFCVKEDPLDNDVYELPHTEVMQTRYSWKKADWEKFQKDVDDLLETTSPKKDSTTAKLKWFTESLISAAKSIPRGCRRDPKGWWTEEITEAVEERDELRQFADRSDDDRKKWLDKSEEVKKLICAGKLEQFKTFVAGLNCHSDSSHTFKTLKRLNGDQAVGNNITIIHKGKEITSHAEKAKAYVEMYADVARKAKNKDLKTRKDYRNIKIKNKSYRKNVKEVGAERIFDLIELKAALKTLKPNRAAGYDGVYNEFFLHLSNNALLKLLELLNLVWMKGFVPSFMKLGVIVPLLKPGKDPEKLESYRPVTLTSNTAKLLERLVVTRMVYIIESEGKLLPHQAGFRKGRCTTDPILRLTDSVMNGFQQKRPHERTLATLVDFSRAFDRVDHNILLSILEKMGLPSRICVFFAKLLKDRKSMCRVGKEFSKERKFGAGVPQGTVSGPILFICYMNSLAEQLHEINNLKFGFFADDLTLWSTHSSPSQAAETVQAGLEIVNSWSCWAKMKVAPEKCEAILFSNWVGDKKPERRPKLEIGGVVLDYKEQVRLLGIILDTKLVFGAHCDKIRKEGLRRVAQLRILANTSWGCSQEDLRIMYVGYVRSVLEYGSDVWGSGISATRLMKLDVVQNQAARLITGCVNKTSIDCLLLEANLVPLKYRFNVAMAKRREKMIRLDDDDPLKQVGVEDGPNRRLQKGTWRTEVKSLYGDIDLSENIEPLLLYCSYAPWECGGAISVKFYPHLLSHVARNDADPDNVKLRKEETMRTLNQRGVFDLELWTDGSVTDEGSVGAAILFAKNEPDPLFKVGAPAGKLVSSFRSEMTALNIGLENTLNFTRLNEFKSLIIATDSQSSINALASGPLCQHSVLAAQVWSKLLMLAQVLETIVFQFTAAHCGVQRNELVDEAATELLNEVNQCEAGQIMEVNIRKIKERNKIKWKENMNDEQLRVSISGKEPTKMERECGMDRSDRVLLAQLRCGQSRFLGSYRKVVGITQDERCRWCSLAVESVVHVFEECQSRIVRRLKRENGIRNRKALWDRPVESAKFVRGLLKF